MSAWLLIQSDLYRYTGAPFTWALLRAAWVGCPGFRWSLWFRLAQHFRGGGAEHRRGWRRLAFWIANRASQHYRERLGFDIPVPTRIGPGFKLGHFGGVVINQGAVIGANVMVCHGATIGRVPVGPRAGVPTIGDRAWIGPGAVVVGAIRIGNDAMIGPNASVYFDVADGNVAVGNPGKQGKSASASGIGSRDYQRNIWEP